MGFDVPTLAFMSLFVGLELTAGFLLAGLLLGRQPGLRQWSASAAVIFTGGVIWMFQAILPETTLAVVSNGLLLLGAAFGWAGARAFCDRPYSTRPFWLGVVPFALAIGWFSEVSPSLRARVIVYSAAASAWSLATAWTFFRHGPRHLRASVRFAGGAYLLHGAFLVARLFFPQSGQRSTDLLLPGWPREVAGLEVIVSSIAFVLALAALLGHRLMADLERAGRIDVLTGVRNRRSVEDEGARGVEVCVATRLPCAVLLFDLDRFKRINDTHGHLAGDAALRHFAAILEPELRRSDLFGRWGGEEFVAVMPGATGDEALAAAERLRALVARSPVSFERASIELTVSIGVAWNEGEGMELGALVARADAALYRAKDGGRDRVIEATGS
ncbi:GGDEF domain-containing protein [Vulgatibacter incomptus]|uniref:diguanylate cyclase n=1 Tax=Vulgatibacter incomptus TaxID=1391653 RepID=A0A0K1PEP7_9BACT|nr:GGDEF domain-containing protein [Vulgatibacter incomptus]AKU91990.1 GGDEF/response regulator receiver domain protein [Vulgatibacter incomptus]